MDEHQRSAMSAFDVAEPDAVDIEKAPASRMVPFSVGPLPSSSKRHADNTEGADSDGVFAGGRTGARFLNQLRDFHDEFQNRVAGRANCSSSLQTCVRMHGSG